MDFTALEREISALENVSDSLGNWLLIWTGVLVLGLVVEYVPSVVELVKDFIDNKPLNRKLLREIIGGILITGGVTGELWVGFQSSGVETKLRTARGKLTEQLRKDAAQAVQNAAEAESHLAEAKGRAAKAEERAAKAEKATEDERIERLKLEKQVAPRRLTPEQQNAIASSLKPFKGRKVRLVTYQLDLEGAILGTQIKPALQKAGIIVDDKTSQILTVGGFAVGIQVNGPPAEQDLVKALVESLRHDGQLQFVGNAGSRRANGADPDAVTILIGAKPVSDLQSLLKK